MKNKPAGDGHSLTKKIAFHDPDLFRMLCGQQGANLKNIEGKVGVSINARGTELLLKGGDWEIELAEKVIEPTV